MAKKEMRVYMFKLFDKLFPYSHSVRTIYMRDMELWVGQQGIDLSLAVRPGASVPRAFGLAKSDAEPVRVGPGPDAVLDTRCGASVNCENLSACFHGAGTHTECVGHIVRERVSVNSVEIPLLVHALVVSVFPQERRTSSSSSDVVISGHQLEEACKAWLDKSDNDVQALIVRALPRGSAPCDFTGTNPPFFDKEAMEYISNKLDIKHLVVDLPSVDKEDCGPDMPNHSIFFGLRPGCKELCQAKRPNTTITELANLNPADDGLYLLSLQVAPIEMDASPSRPRLFPPKKSWNFWKQNKWLATPFALVALSGVVFTSMMFSRHT